MIRKRFPLWPETLQSGEILSVSAACLFCCLFTSLTFECLTSTCLTRWERFGEAFRRNETWAFNNDSSFTWKPGFASQTTRSSYWCFLAPFQHAKCFLFGLCLSPHSKVSEIVIGGLNHVSSPFVYCKTHLTVWGQTLSSSQEFTFRELVKPSIILLGNWNHKRNSCTNPNSSFRSISSDDNVSIIVYTILVSYRVEHISLFFFPVSPLFSASLFAPSIFPMKIFPWRFCCCLLCAIVNV